jgi:hypothetical protein
MHRASSLLLLAALVPSPLPASDGAEAGRDPARTGATADALLAPLKPAWTHWAPLPPDPAWPDPARQDFWNYRFNLNPAVTYDRAFHVVAAGGSVYYGSSADDGIHALDAATGARRWSFFTEIGRAHV